jgi:hypothetical protein
MSPSSPWPPGLGTETETQWARRAALAIWDRLTASDYAGWDPYDALNARFLPSGLKNARFVRRALTQAVKRTPLSLQPLLGVRREADAYTLGHVLLAGTRLAIAEGQPSRLREVCEQVVARLRTMAVAEDGQLAWGYHFPVHTRFFSYVPPTPNLIVTAFVVKGMAAATRSGLVDCGTEILGATEFVLHGLPRVADGTGHCIGYVPNETTVVHNANMLAALVLCEAADVVNTDRQLGSAALAQPSQWLDAALACARFTAARQATDGSWPYSEESYGRWVDGFHTGFVLEGMVRVILATGDDELRRSFHRGVRYYVAQFFGPEGEPKYYPQKPYPFDALSAAQGVETLHVAVGGHAARAVPGQIDWIRRHLVGSDGRVTYQVHRGWSDRREFPRWSSAPLMSALAGVAAVPATSAASTTEGSS